MILAKYQWIEGDQAFSELCQHFSFLNWVVLDTEFVRERTYYPGVGLLQFSDNEHCYLVDPLSISHWQPLVELLKSDITWVMHACSEDLDVLHHLTKATPKCIFDTQVAAGFLGMGESLGYAALVKEMLQIDLDKSHSRTNWLARPLSEQQLCYAVNDVCYLAKLWLDLNERLLQRNFNDFFKEDMQKLSEWKEVDPELAYKKIKMAWSLQSQMEIAQLQALASWREKKSRILDRVKKHILEDEQLIALSKLNTPTSTQELLSLNILNERKIKQYGTEIVNELNQLDITQSNAVIPVRIIDLPGAKKTLNLWKLKAQKVAQSHGIPERILFSQRSLQSLYKYKQGLSKVCSTAWTDWRLKLLESELV
ncbi:MAG: ribonuclease D [Gammaproteobacteria bacterium CG22_combo_CG10-13_8_21_14_all_40_8]|nr:MAG: ribonuclease D [Gammaproteobacteria bacterium CG22_combo_CG10-13_8_21_14_all_40_8]